MFKSSGDDNLKHMKFFAAADHRTIQVRDSAWSACKVLLMALAAMFCFRAPGAVAATSILTNLQQVVSVTNDVLNQPNIRAVVQGNVTFAMRDNPWVFVQEGTNALLVTYPGPITNFAPGTRIEADGNVGIGDYAPYLQARKFSVLGPGELPEPWKIDPNRLPPKKSFGEFVEHRGYIHDLLTGWGNVWLQIVDGNRRFHALVRVNKGFKLPKDWLDAEVSVRGICWPAIDEERRTTDFNIHSSGTNLITFLSPGRSNLFGGPVVSVTNIFTIGKKGARIRTQGSVSFVSIEGHFYVEDGGQSVAVSLLKPMRQGDTAGEKIQRTPPEPLRPGDRIDLVAEPTIVNSTLALRDAEYIRVGGNVRQLPVQTSVGELITGKHRARLVRIRGRLAAREIARQTPVFTERLVLEDGNNLFAAQLENPDRVELRLGDTGYLEVVGLNIPEAGFGNRVHSFTVHVQELGDIRPASAPRFWEKPQMLRGILIVGLLLLLAGLWILLQHRHMKRIRSSEERFRTLMEQSFDSTIVLGSEGKVRYLSPGAERLFGRAREGVSHFNTGPGSVVHPEDLPKILQTQIDLQQEPGLRSGLFSYRVYSADGGIRVVEAVATNCLQIPGVEGIVMNIRDVTERVQADESARRSEAVTRTMNYFATSLLEKNTEEEILWDLIDNCVSQLGFVDCVIYLLDRERNVLVQKAAFGTKTSGRHQILNPITIPVGKGIVGSVAACRRAEIIPDTSLDERYIVDDERRFSEIAVPIIAGDRVIGVIDSEHPSKNFFTGDHLKTLEAVASLCANKLVRIWAEEELRSVNSDLERRVAERTMALRAEVDGRQQAEWDLRVALKAEKELNQLKSSFVSMVSHEFRTPLEVILSSSNILDRYLDRLPADKRKAQLRAIRKSVHRMNDLVEEVLLLGKFDAGRMACNPAPLDLARICHRVVVEVESAANREGAVQFQLFDCKESAYGDESLLQHILGNLLSNALKYSPSDKAVELMVRDTGNNVEFIVRDSGCGIPEPDQCRLFTAFYRGSNVAQTHGSGLGLVIVKRCVDLHCGTIRFESGSGTGTTFFVTLPLFGETEFRRKFNSEAVTTSTQPS